MTRGSRKPGRPRTVMTEDVIADLLRLVRAGLPAERAAAAIGVQPASMRSHKARHASFAAQITRAEAVAEASALAVLQRAMSAGDANSAKFILERRWPERWARPEIRAEVANLNISTDDMARAIHAGLAAIAERHAPLDDQDQEDLLPSPLPEHPGSEPPTVSRS